jgi:hypothetical protein
MFDGVPDIFRQSLKIMEGIKILL